MEDRNRGTDSAGEIFPNLPAISASVTTSARALAPMQEKKRFIERFGITNGIRMLNEH